MTFWMANLSICINFMAFSWNFMGNFSDRWIYQGIDIVIYHIKLPIYHDIYKWFPFETRPHGSMASRRKNHGVTPPTPWRGLYRSPAFGAFQLAMATIHLRWTVYVCLCHGKKILNIHRITLFFSLFRRPQCFVFQTTTMSFWIIEIHLRAKK